MIRSGGVRQKLIYWQTSVGCDIAKEKQENQKRNDRQRDGYYLVRQAFPPLKSPMRLRYVKKSPWSIRFFRSQCGGFWSVKTIATIATAIRFTAA